VTAPATLEVIAWDQSRAWFPEMKSYVRDMLLKYLQLSTPMSRTQAKKIVKQLISKQLITVVLEDGQYADGMRHWLESIGAQVQVYGGEKAIS
jgi:aspartate aminotransferase-like enzyme